jgi:hypothetical protein
MSRSGGWSWRDSRDSCRPSILQILRDCQPQPRRALRLAHDRQLLPTIPKVRVLPENNTRQGFLERPDLEAAVAALPAYLQDLTRFAYLTGWR